MQMRYLYCSGNRVYTEFYVTDAFNKIAIASVFIREGNTLNAFCSNVLLGNPILVCTGDIKEENVYSNHISEIDNDKSSQSLYDVRYFPIHMGKETFYHGMIINKNLFEKGNMFMINNEADFDTAFFNKLMIIFDLPLLIQWVGYIKKRFIEDKMLFEGKGHYSYDLEGRELSNGDFSINTASVKVYTILANNNYLKEIISSGLANKDICICEQEQQPLIFKNIDEYFTNYGHMSVNKLKESIRVLSPYKPKVDLITLDKTLMPQQATLVNGAVECLKHKNYVLQNEGMGTGKVRRCA